MSLLAAEAVGKSYRSDAWFAASPVKRVLHDVDLEIAPGECVGLLGRSGCGKSTLARLLLGLEKPDTGRILFRRRGIAGLGGEERRGFRRAVQLVFQDSIGAVDPRHTIGRTVSEPLRHLTDLKGDARAARVAELLALVGLDRRDADRLPCQMSGGQLQRVCIARALAARPELIVLDEAVSNLDLVLQLQVLDLLAQLRRQLGTAFLFITHDLRLTRRLCDRVLVMEEGRIVDAAKDVSGLHHPASRMLRESVLPARPT
ncbi:MAG: nickel import ATP-binding protein NikE [Pseudomonadota bacterium]